MTRNELLKKLTGIVKEKKQIRLNDIYIFDNIEKVEVTELIVEDGDAGAHSWSKNWFFPLCELTFNELYAIYKNISKVM